MTLKGFIKIFLQSAIEVYYEVHQALQSVTEVYYKVFQVLQSVPGITKCERTKFQSVSAKDFVEFMLFWKMLFD